MSNKKSLWSIMFFTILVLTFMFSISLNYQGKEVFAEPEEEKEHISFEITVDGESSKVINVPYQDNEGLLAIKYTVTENTGVDALQLQLSYDAEAFTLDHVTTKDDTALGAATKNGANIVFENTGVSGAAYKATGDALIVAYFSVNANAIKAKSYSFGITDINDGKDFSNAWRIVKSDEESSTHTPVEIRFTSPTVYIRGTFEFTLTGGSKTYDGVAASNDAITLATTCDNAPEVNKVWFTQTGENSYAKLNANPVAAGTYYVVIEYAATNYYEAYCGYTASGDEYTLDDVEGHVAVYKILPREVTVTIANKTSVYSESLVELTSSITAGSLVEGDNLNVTLSTTATTSSNVGEYPITGEYNNSNYLVTFVNGTYTITKKAITITALDQTAKYNGKEPTVDQSKYTVSPEVSISGVTITKAAGVAVGPYTLTPAYSNSNYEVTLVNGTFTITTAGLTQADVDGFMESYAKFYAVDKRNPSVTHELEIVDYKGNYTKTYDTIGTYIAVSINSFVQELNAYDERISRTVQYTISDRSGYEELQASISNFADYSRKDAGTYVVEIQLVAGEGYAFAEGVISKYEITLKINKKALTITASSDVQYKEAEVITVDNGTNGWAGTETYETYETSAEALKDYVSSNYEINMTAGTPYALTWAEGAEAAIETILYNYDVTLAVEENLTVAKKVLNATAYDFLGYSAPYDGASHDLTIKDADELISSSFSPKASVKDVKDSGTYQATITLVDTDNYTFEGGEHTGWTVNAGNTSATKSAQVAITSVELTISAEYTKTTATFTISGYKGQDTLADLTDLVYLADGQNTNVSGNVYTINGYVAAQITVSATTTNTNYTIKNATLKNIRQVEYQAGTYDPDKAGMTPTLPQTEYLFDGFTAVEPQQVALKHYTFVHYSETNSLTSAAFDFENTAITANKVLYVIWNENPKYTITLYYMVEGDSTTLTEVGKTSYYNDVEIHYSSELPEVAAKDWFKVQKWYTDTELSTKFADGSKLTQNINLYANYKFNIGLGDVNANGFVDANDITLYRQWIVGGYEMTVVESGNEWATVNSNNYNKENTYFLKRVADSNAQTSESLELGDNHLDIRDVSTIRMALVGGYGFSIMLGKYVDGEELIVVRSISINNVSDLLIVARSGAEAKLSADIEEVNFSGSLTECEKDVLIDLNGKTLTLKSLSIALKAGNTGKIQIKNGTIRVADGQGVSLLAPNGSVILDNVTLYDENGQFTLQAANQSLHLVNTVKFLQKGTNSDEVAAQVKVEKDTHVVVEEAATVTVEKLVVTNNFKPTTDEQYDIAIENKSNATPTITVEGNTKDYISTLAELLAAAENGGDYKLVSDIRYSGRVTFTANATLNLNGHLIESVNNVALAATNGAKLTIYGEGNVKAQEGCVMAFYGSEVVINGGTYTCTDNFVFGTNGSNGAGQNTITINAGTFNGYIKSAGYVACGIYVANNDTVVVNGGTFNIENGVGILARSGNTTVGENVEINITSTGTVSAGKVGDAQINIEEPHELVVDSIANYPGGKPTLVNNTTYDVLSMVDTKDDLQTALTRNGKVVIYADITYSGQLYSNRKVTLDLNGHKLESTNDVALWSIGSKCNLTITGNGIITAQEAALMAGYGAKLTVENGTFNAKDNFVVGTNGSAGQGGNTITINGGTFNGKIQSNNYIACGVYAANNDTITINAGTFNIENGLGVLVRAGHVTVDDEVEYNFTTTENGLTSGYVGDSSKKVPTGKEVVVDYISEYPGKNIDVTYSGQVYAMVGNIDQLLGAAELDNSYTVLLNDITTNDEKPIRFISVNATLDLNGHNITSTNDVALRAIDANLTITGNGTITAQEAALMAFDGATLTVENGTFNSLDNFVVGTNGTAGRGENTIIINGGTFYGNIQSAGYVACGIYVANNDTVTVNAGTFYVTNGVGILARSGNTTIKSGVVFHVTGDGTLGKVGDSKVTVPAGEVLVIDYAANYPGGNPTLINKTAYSTYALVDDEESLYYAGYLADIIVLNNDIELNYGFYAEKSLTLNLNGHKLYNTVDLWELGDYSLVCAYGDNITLTINGEGSLLAKENDCYAVTALNGATVVINGGTYAGNCHSVYIWDATVVVNGGYFYVQQPSSNPSPYGYVLNCYDANYQAEEAHFIVNGGQFENFNPADCAAEGANTNFVSEGYEVTSETVNDKTIYTVQKSN